MTKQEFVEWIRWQDRNKTLKSDELLAKLDTLIKSEIEAKYVSLQSVIERVAAEKMGKPPKGNDDWEYNQGLDKAIEILKSTPCIKAKAQKNIVGEYFVLKNFGKLDKNVPEFDIEILLP